MDWTDRIGRRVRLRDLHIVLAVAECGSMAKASAHLAISHPVVSKTISDLEQTLGVQLFDRSAKGVELTSYGRALLKCGVTVFDEMRQGLKQIEFLSNPDSGQLAIGCTEIAVAGVLPGITQKFLQKNPGVKLNMALTDTALLQFNELRERHIELQIGRMPRSLPDNELMAEALFDEPFIAVAGVKSAWARRPRIKLADLVGAPWILPPYDSVPGTLIAEIFHAAGLEPPHPSVSTLSIELTSTLVGSGGFVGLLPRSVVQSSSKRAGLKSLPVRFEDPHIAVGIVTVRNRTLSPLAQRFIDCAKEVTSSIPKPRLA
jgi:DNA-binding transcriptional LysR family regulator